MDIREIRKEEPVEVFKVGEKVFKTQEEAEQYIVDVQESTQKQYFKVSYKPDLTEGRGYYREMLITTKSELGINLVFTFLQKLLGNPMAWVQGVSAMPNYVVTEVEVKNYEQSKSLINSTYTSLGSSVQKSRDLIELGTPKTEHQLDALVFYNKYKLDK